MPTTPPRHGFLGESEMARRIAEFDWARTSLGPIAGWSETLRATIATILRAPLPITTLWGEDGVMIYNDAYSALSGSRHPTLLGSKVREGWPEVADFNDNVVRVVYGRGETLSYKEQRLALDRGAGPRPAWMNLDYSPIVDAEGKLLGVMAIVVETTDRVHADRALRASEARFRAFAEAMPNQAWTATADGRLDWVNERIGEYTGLPSADLIGAGWFDVIHPDDRDRAEAEWKVALGSGAVYETEFRVRRADGAWRWHLIRAVAMRDESGAIRLWTGTNTDIDERKQAEARSIRDLERVWNLSPVLKLVTDTEGKISTANPAWTRVLGWTLEETISAHAGAFVAPDSPRVSAFERSRDTADSAWPPSSDPATGAPQGRVTRLMRAKTGGDRLIEWISVFEAGALYAFGRDVTAEVEAEAALRESEARLAQAHKMEAIGQLTGGIAHDFNNLLQVIGGNLQLLASKVAGDPRAEAHMDYAVEGVRRGARLSQQLLAFGRRQPLAPEVVNPARLMRGLDEMLRRVLGEAIEVETSVGEGLWNTYVDPGNIENALLNLAINARDAMESAGKLTIEAGNAVLDQDCLREHPDVSPGHYVMLAVTDTGSGMGPDVVAKAFEPFFTTKPEGRGTGLGLSMVYGFVKQSGGHVKIYSEIGEGTTVKLYLPRSTQAETEPLPRFDGPAIGGRETILVAEDDPAVRRTVVETLEGLGYNVLRAADAGAALAIIDSGAHVDLLFTDVVMPGPLKAPELVRAATARRPGLKVLFTSGYTENAIMHRGRLDDGVELLSKPYAREDLARKLRFLLGPSPDGLAAPAAPTSTPEPAPEPAPEAAAVPREEGLTILVCEDEPLILFSVIDILEDLGHRVLEAGSGAEALARLAETPVDLLLTDLGLPDMEGGALAATARATRPDLPVIYATGQIAPDTVEPRARWLAKPFSAADLARAISELR